MQRYGARVNGGYELVYLDSSIARTVGVSG
jgi:hypothetical protein